MTEVLSCSNNSHPWTILLFGKESYDHKEEANGVQPSLKISPVQCVRILQAFTRICCGSLLLLVLAVRIYSLV